MMSDVDATKDETPLQRAQKMLAAAELKLQKSSLLKLIDAEIFDSYAVQLQSGVSERVSKASPKGMPSWSNNLIRDAMGAGCKALSKQLEAESRDLAHKAGELLRPPPVMRGGDPSGSKQVTT